MACAWGRARSWLTSVALTSIASDSRRSRTHPSCPYNEAVIRAVRPYSWTHTRATMKGQMGEHAGVRRAPPRHCAARRAAGLVWENGAVSGGRCLVGEGDRSNRGGDGAGAHARHMRRRTSGLCQLTLPPRSISRLSSASLPSLAACHTALPIESLIASAALKARARSDTCRFRGARAAPR